MVISSHTCTQECNLHAKVVNGLEEKGRGIGHFQSYMHTQNTTHLLKLTIRKRGEALVTSSLTYTHKYNLHTEVVNSWEEKGRGIGHFQSYMHTKHNSLSVVDNGLHGRERHWPFTVIHAHKTQLTG